MGTNRLEAFSDGVIAIIITIMVLELKVPHGTEFSSLEPLIPVFLSYILSFVYIAIYWSNHHHLLHTAKHVNGSILWANMHLLFWLSLIPFATGWMGENHFHTIPVALYGVVLTMSGLAYYILVQVLISSHPDNTLLVTMAKGLKGKISLTGNLSAIPLAFVSPYISMAIFFALSAIWFIPDKRIEDNINKD